VAGDMVVEEMRFVGEGSTEGQGSMMEADLVVEERYVEEECDDYIARECG